MLIQYTQQKVLRRLIQICIISVLLLLQIYAHAQTPIADSLKQHIKSATNAEEKLKAIITYCEEFQSLNRDTVFYYAQEAMRLAQNHNNLLYRRQAELAFANAYFVWGWVDSTLYFTESALQEINTDDHRFRKVYFKLLRQKALCFGATSRFPEALENLYTLLNEAKAAGDSAVIASTLNTIGSVQISMDDAGNALTFIMQAKQYIQTGREALLNLANIYTNLAYAHFINGNTDSATVYIAQAIPICRQAMNLNSLATSLRVQSSILTSTKNFVEAETALIEMQEIRRTLTGSSNIVEDHIQLANFYASTGNLDKAIQFCLDNLRTVVHSAQGDTSAGSISELMRMKLRYYEVLSGFYKQAGNTEAYTQTLENIVIAKDSFYAANNALAMAEMQTRYEVQQKENTILEQQVNLAKKNIQVYGISGMLLLSALMGFIFFREYKRRQATRMKEAMEAEKIAAALAVQDAEEKERKRIAADLHDTIGTQANAIIYHAGILQKSKEAEQNVVESLYDSATQMLNNLRETLWAMKTQDISAEELWIRLISYSKKMAGYYPHIRFSAKGNAPQLIVHSVKALHIIMVVQEAIQNAIKHAQAANIEILSDANNSNWIIEIKDNGTGFDFTDNAQKMESYGLQNMQERARMHNMQLSIVSTQGQGTSIQLMIPQ